MSKLKVSIKKSTVTAMMKAGRKERINETELSQLARIKPCGIMHVTKTKKDSVIYTCPANINLTDRLKKAISKYDFFFMIEQIVIMVEDVYNNGLNVNSVRFNMDDVYINEMTKEMYFIYFPIVGGQESADIVGFIENIIYTMTPVINEDTELYIQIYVLCQKLPWLQRQCNRKIYLTRRACSCERAEKQSSDNAADNAATDNAATDNAAGNAGQHGWNYSVVR